MQLMTAALEAGNQRRRPRTASTTSSPARATCSSAQDLSQHGPAAPAVRAVRAEDLAACRSSTCRCAARACRSSSAANRASARPTRCSVVTAPYEVDGEVVGTVGVIGPTRMAYERVIPIVDITAKLLSSALSQHPERHPPRQPRHAGGADARRRCARYLAEFLSDPRVVRAAALALAADPARHRPARAARASRAAKYAPDLDAGGLAARRAHRRQARLLRRILAARSPRRLRHALRRAVDRRRPECATACRRGRRAPPLPAVRRAAPPRAVRDVLPAAASQIDRAVPRPPRATSRRSPPACAPLGGARPRREAGDELPRPAATRGRPRRSLPRRSAWRPRAAGRKRCACAPAEYRVTFQSRFGAAEWLQPYTGRRWSELARSGQSPRRRGLPGLRRRLPGDAGGNRASRAGARSSTPGGGNSTPCPA